MVEYQSSDAQVFTTDSIGELGFVGEGTAELTVVFIENPVLSALVPVSVTAPAVVLPDEYGFVKPASGAVIGFNPTDLVLVFDNSAITSSDAALPTCDGGNAPECQPGSILDAQKAAALALLDEISLTTTKVGVMVASDSISVLQDLTHDRLILEQVINSIEVTDAENWVTYNERVADATEVLSGTASRF